MRKLTILLSCLVLGGPTLSALAQGEKKPEQPPAGDRPGRGNRPGGGGGGGGGGGPGGGGMMRGPQMDPTKAKAAQELEATGVAKHAGLNEAQTKSLITAYLAARESHGAAAAKMRQEMMDAAQNGGDRPDMSVMQQKMQDLNKSERDKFQKALGSSLSAEQTAKIMASLGTFNAQWDRYVDSLAELKLDAAKQQQGLDAIESYILASEKARSGDRDAMRDAMQDAREKLNESMKKILSEEQFNKFESGMRPGGRGQGGPGGGDGGQQRRRPRDGGNDGGGK